MSIGTGFSDQTPALPKGGGAIGGLGETYTPDLATGTGSFTVPLDLPNGPNDIGPRLALRYDSGSGNGPFGMGFSLPLPRIMCSTARGFPRYDSSDRLLLEGAGELLALPDGAYRLEVEGGAWQVTAHEQGFRLTDRLGRYYFLGISPEARLADPSAPDRTFAWHLERIEDALGNKVTFHWQREGAQLYLAAVAYSIYEARLHYGPRPDVQRWGRAGFLISTALRCERIELHLPSSPQPLLRRWTLDYTNEAANGCSLLEGVTLSGLDEAGSQLDAPRLRLGYSGFQPRELLRFQSADEGESPGPLRRQGRRVELVDWDGDGLPDLLEIGGGGATRLWPNLGDCRWGRPRRLGALPLFASPEAPVGLADMDGNGVADLIRLDKPVAGYVPRSPGEGFERPVAWRQAPAVPPGAPNARLVDLDGDGVVDLIASSEQYLSLYYRADGEGWAPRPQVIPRGEAPNLNLADPHVFLADMTGDGSADLVRVNGGGVTYWPYLGRGRWGAPVRMAHQPDLPFDVRPERLILSDIDGDGCADLVYVDHGRVRYWINSCGVRFGDERTIEFLPTGQIGQFRLADMRGSGTAGLLWSAEGPLNRGASYFYLDFCGDAKPYLLTAIDSGVGLRTTISYTTSARQAAADARAGRPWSSTLPVVVPVVAAIRKADTAAGRTMTTTYSYHDGRYDGVLREFAGFGRVDEQQSGDRAAPILSTTYWFHTGVDLDEPRRRLTLDERRRLRSIRGRLYRHERYGLDGSQQEQQPYDRQEQRWGVITVATPVGPVYQPRLEANIRTALERQSAAVARITTITLAWDAFANPTETVEVSETTGDMADSRHLRTRTHLAADPAGRFFAHAWRVQQFDQAGLAVSDTLTHFDDAPEGQIGAQGLITRRSSLVLTDALVAENYGQDVPDFGGLGYYRRPGEQGWWIDEARYRREDSPSGLKGTVTGPLGVETVLEFDRHRLFPVRVSDPHGNTIAAEYDYRACRVAALTDASGAVYRAQFDALGRTVAIVEPGDSAALPTVTYTYITGTLPIEATMHRRAVSGGEQTTVIRELFDGEGRLLERRERDETGEIAALSQVCNSRGLLVQQFIAHRPAGTTYTRPGADLPHIQLSYDALGRLIEQRNPDGGVRRLSYGPLLVEQADEEDTRGDAAATHAGTPARTWLDATGRVRAIEQNLEGSWLRSEYGYDLKGNLTAHRDELGNLVRLWYDLLGRTLRTERPEHGSVTILDAAGNNVEARGRDGRRVLREFDGCNRPIAVRYDSLTAAPAMRFAYHDAGRPAPSEAGSHTRGGRCVRIDDEGGTTVFDYDQRGRIAVKRTQPANHERSYELGFSHRADGQLAAVTYPDGGGGRLVVRYEYNRRGLLVRIPSFINALDYHLSGHRARVRYANGVEQRTSYDERSGRLTAMELAGPGGAIRTTNYTSDLVGNIVRIDSSDPAVATTYTYDDLYRLVGARTDGGEAWSYSYDAAGNLTSKSDVGEYRYGENGAPATCLTSAGGDAFSYTPHGEMHRTPWGEQRFNQQGRMAGLTSPDGQRTLEFRYDYLGRRVATRSQGGGPAERLTPDRLYSVEDGTLVLQIFDGRGLVARRTATGVLFIHADHLGGPVAVTDGGGQVVGRLRYDPFGTVMEQTGAPGAIAEGFTGGEREQASGLLYLNARYYHPRIGRFVSPDTIVQHAGDPMAWASYVYCRNNPVLYIDPSGNGFFEALVGGLAIAGLVAIVVASGGIGALGVGASLALIGVGVVSGGVIGGLAAARKGGDLGDIITGVLVGGAVGGWAAYASCYAGAALAGKLGLSTNSFWGAVVSQGVNGTINGAGTGFAAGFAGGKGSFDEVMSKMLGGALIGAATGAVLGAWQANPISNQSLGDRIQQQVFDPVGNVPSSANPFDYVNYAGTVLDTPNRFKDAVLGWGLQQVQSYATSQVGQLIVVDAVSGAWSLGYAQAQIETVATALFVKDVGGPLLAEALTPVWNKLVGVT